MIPPTQNPGAGSASATPVVHVVDGESAIRSRFRQIGKNAGVEVRVFGAAEPFFAAVPLDAPGCLVLDSDLPDHSGLEVLSHMAAHGSRMPVVFMSGYADVNEAVRALRLGSLDFVQKPFATSEMLGAIQRALEADRRRRADVRLLGELHARFASLTPREWEVMSLVVEGRPNKLIATRLGVSPKTIEVHRSQVMRKTRAGSLAELVRLSIAAGLSAMLGEPLLVH